MHLRTFVPYLAATKLHAVVLCERRTASNGTADAADVQARDARNRGADFVKGSPSCIPLCPPLLNRATAPRWALPLGQVDRGSVYLAHLVVSAYNSNSNEY